jgi:hypothetical protein
MIARAEFTLALSITLPVVLEMIQTTRAEIRPRINS